MVSPVCGLLQSSSSMAVNAHSIPKLLPLFSSSSYKSPNPCIFNPSSLTSHNSFLGTFLKFSVLHPSSRTTPRFSNSAKKRPISAVVSSSLPTANPERLVGEKVPKWSMRAIRSFALGELESRKLRYSTTGTEGILMGILVEGTSLASKFLWENGITLFKVRDECIKIVGKGNPLLGPEHPPLTESAQRALDWAMDKKLKSGEDGEITPAELLLGIWSEVESPGQKILAALGFDDEKAKKLQALSSDPDFNDK